MDKPPVNQWIEEQVTVKEMSLEDRGGGKFGYVPKDVQYTQKTMYVDAPKRKFMCAKGKHEFYQENAGRYLFACSSCSFKKVAHPVTYRFNPETKQLVYRHNSDVL